MFVSNSLFVSNDVFSLWSIWCFEVWSRMHLWQKLVHYKMCTRFS